MAAAGGVRITHLSTLDESGPPQALLAGSVVEPGQVWERVVKTPAFIIQVTITTCICAGVHVLVGWLAYRQWGKIPFSEAGDACAVWPGHQPPHGIAIDQEVFVDAFLTAFFVSSGQLQRITDVHKGKLPRVAADAFPRGRLLSCLFPRGPRVRGNQAPTRKDHSANVASWFLLALSWCFVWGGFTFVVVFVMWAAPAIGNERYWLCMSPWTFIAARAVWTSIQGAAVCAGSYILWCTRGDRAAPVGAASALTGTFREPFSPTADFVSVN